VRSRHPIDPTEARNDDSANGEENAWPSRRFFGLDVYVKLSEGLGKPARRLVAEALYGIAARGSVRLSEIGRSLEEAIPLIKTETRLSRNLARPKLRDHVGGAVLREGSRKVGEQRTLLIVDLSDIAKPYAEKMEYLARVRDGSTGDIADGYWLCQVIAVENEDNAIVPLYSALYSQEAPDFVSENAEIKGAMAAVSEARGRVGVGGHDRLPSTSFEQPAMIGAVSPDWQARRIGNMSPEFPEFCGGSSLLPGANLRFPESRGYLATLATVPLKVTPATKVPAPHSYSVGLSTRCFL